MTNGFVQHITVEESHSIQWVNWVDAESQRGEPGLVDRVLALHAGSRGFDSHRGHMSERFFSDPIDQDIRTQCALSWKIVVSEWRSVIAVSLNVCGGVPLIKPTKLYMCRQNTTNTTWMDARCRVCEAMVPSPEPLRERRYENWNTHTHMMRRAWPSG